jgi:NADH:ubiquinone oxidoreductase subunit F (NADH-binding)
MTARSAVSRDVAYLDARRHEDAALSLLPAPVHFHTGFGEVLSTARSHSLHDHLTVFGPAPTKGDDLLRTLEHIELTGRGGGHFPVVRKWQVAYQAGGGGLVVANGAEGELHSRKDAALLRLRPHLVLDGVAAAARTVGAKAGVIWLHEGDHAAAASISSAIDQRRTAGLREVHMRIEVGPDRYLSGESSAIVRSLSGGPTLPVRTSRPAAVSGVGGAPTLVHNVETLAHVALALRWGTAYTPNALVTLADGAARTVVEVGATETIRDLIGGRSEPQAVLVGGAGGTWSPWGQIADLALTPAAYEAAGVPLGAGVLYLVDADECGVQQTALLARFLAEQGARQCGPCLFGLPAVAQALETLAAGRSRHKLAGVLARHLDEVSGRGGCHHPDGAARMVRSALNCFAEDVRAHLHGRCLHVARPLRGRWR